MTSTTLQRSGTPSNPVVSISSERKRIPAWLVVTWSVSGGSQTARLGGTTQVPLSVVTEITPAIA